MRSIVFFVFVSNLVFVAGQCFAESCSTCLEQRDYNRNPCAWCQGIDGNVFGSCQEPYSPNSCPYNMVEVTTCPSAPSPASTALTRSSPLLLVLLGLFASVLLGVATFTPAELLCGKKTMHPTPQDVTSKRPGSCSVCTLFIGTFFLWISFFLLLASPSLPWLMHTAEPISSSSPPLFSFQYATAFAQFECYPVQDPTSSAHTCTESLGTDNVKEYDSQGAYTGYINNGFALGIISYIFTLALVLPTTLISSAATFRLQGLNKYNTPPYSGGCSIVSLAVAGCLGWIATAAVAIVLIFALSLCSNLSQDLTQRSTFFSPSTGGSDVSYLLQPGPLALVSALLFLTLGLALVSLVACRTSGVPGLGCNSTGTCCNRVKIRLEFEDGDGGEPLLMEVGELPPNNPNSANGNSTGGRDEEGGNGSSSSSKPLSFKTASPKPTFMSGDPPPPPPPLRFTRSIN